MHFVTWIASLAALSLCNLALAEGHGPVTGVIFDGGGQTAPVLSVLGMPAVMRISLWPWQGAPEPLCVAFRLGLEQTMTEVELVTTGLGRTLLTAARGDIEVCNKHDAFVPDRPLLLPYELPTAFVPTQASSQPSDRGQRHGTERLTLSRPETMAGTVWTIGLQLDAHALAADGTSIEGQVMVLAQNYGMTSLPLKLERLPTSAIWVGVSWFLAIAVPAGLGYLLAELTKYSAARLQARDDMRAAREKELVEFQAYRLEPTAVHNVIELFEQQLPAEFQPAIVRPCHRVFDWMFRSNLLAKIPQQELMALRLARDSEDQNQFKRLLKELFPELDHDV